MRNLLALAVVLVALAGCGQPEWQPLIVNEGGFSVLMPRDPTYARQQLQTPAGPMQAHLYSADRRESYFAVGYSDYPLALAIGTEPKQLFSGVRDTWLRRVNGTLETSDSSLKLAGKHPGFEFTARGTVKGTDAFLHARLYLVDQRLYQVVAIGRKSGVSQGIVNRFLNSFKPIEVTEVGSLRIDQEK